MNFKIVLPSILAVVLLASGCSNAQHTNNPVSSGATSPTKTTSPSSIPSIALNQIYTNTKYSYSFKYPEDYQLGTFDEEASLPTAVSNDSGQVYVFKKKSADYIVTISADVHFFPSFSVQGIENDLGTMTKNTIITPTEIFGLKGYKLTSNGNDKSIKSDSYFIQNKSGIIFMLIIFKDNPIAQQIFNSFKFTQ